MKVGVCAKVTPDTDARIKIAGDAIDTAGIKFVISPYDDFAIEEAILTKEKAGGEVIAFTAGDDSVIAPIRQGALARGADKAVLISDEAVLGSDSLGKARALAAAIQKEGCELVFCGKVGIDHDNAQVPAMIAELLGWAQVSNVSEFSVDGDAFTAVRSMDGGVRQKVTGKLPVVITADRGLNSPRYAKLPAIMKAKKKPVDKLSAGDLGLSADDLAPAANLSGLGYPAERPAGRKLDGDVDTMVDELVRLLREEAKVL